MYHNLSESHSVNVNYFENNRILFLVPLNIVSAMVGTHNNIVKTSLKGINDKIFTNVEP